jgi:hypothetical protein
MCARVTAHTRSPNCCKGLLRRQRLLLLLLRQWLLLLLLLLLKGLWSLQEPHPWHWLPGYCRRLHVLIGGR